MSGTCWSVTAEEYLDAPAASILVFHNSYPQGKQGGIEIIHHGERVASCGEVRTDPTAGRPPAHSRAGDREADSQQGLIQIEAHEPTLRLDYTVSLRTEGDAVRLTVDLDDPLPEEADGWAGFCLELFPPAYRGKTYHLGDTSGVLPQEPNRPVEIDDWGRRRATSMARGKRLVLAPEDERRKMVIEGLEGNLHLFDGRKGDDEAWFTLWTPLPCGVAERAVEWLIQPFQIEGWRREPVICLSQVGYHPAQAKRAVIALDRRTEQFGQASLLRVSVRDGLVPVLSREVEPWGEFLRHAYALFDFTDVAEPGLYVLRYEGQSAGPFRIDPDLFEEGVWQPTLEVFFPVQMCHASVWDGLRLWHGACHLDDALQAPTAHEHLDKYSQGPETDTDYEPFEHIPGLNVGGWHDAGDTDLAAGSQARTVHLLALAREEFGVDTDQTTIIPERRLVLMHRPDGTPDIVQQVAWGVECLLGGYRAAGHSFCGIIASGERPFYQRGEVSTMTDNLIYDPALDPAERTGTHSGAMDDRWAFTSRDTSLDYQVVAALAAASRVLAGYYPDLSEECLATARRTWQYEQTHPASKHWSAYVPGRPEAQEVMATVELLLTTGEERYRVHLVELLPAIQRDIAWVGWAVARALPAVRDEAFSEAVRDVLEDYRDRLAEDLAKNPFGVPYHPRIWGIAWHIELFAVAQYYLARTHPELFDRGPLLDVLNYVLGCHPGNNLSLASSVGTRSVTCAFGINRSSWHYVPGGVVSGPNLIRPDFPELKEQFPFLWQQSEYVMPGAASYIFCVLAADRLLNGERPG